MAINFTTIILKDVSRGKGEKGKSSLLCVNYSKIFIIPTNKRKANGALLLVPSLHLCSVLRVRYS